MQRLGCSHCCYTVVDGYWRGTKKFVIVLKLDEVRFVEKVSINHVYKHRPDVGNVR